MSWISDVKHQFGRLDRSRETLKKFGLVVGTAFILIAGFLWVKLGWKISVGVVGGAGLLLMGMGILAPEWLKHVHRVWMGFAFAMGWVVSRIILVIVYYLVLTPISLIARAVGKRFVEIHADPNAATYWVRKEKQSDDYTKMY